MRERKEVREKAHTGGKAKQTPPRICGIISSILKIPVCFRFSKSNQGKDFEGKVVGTAVIRMRKSQRAGKIQ